MVCIIYVLYEPITVHRAGRAGNRSISVKDDPARELWPSTRMIYLWYRLQDHLPFMAIIKFIFIVKRPMFTGFVAIFCQSSSPTRQSDINFRRPLYTIQVFFPRVCILSEKNLNFIFCKPS